MKKHSHSHISITRAFFAALLLSLGASLGWLGFASTPPTDSITVPSTPGQTVSVTWTGTIPVLNNNTSDCSAPFAGTPLVDQHVSTVIVPAGVYNNLDAYFKFKISWIPSTGQETTNDEILTILNPDGSELNSSDGGSTTETVRGQNLAGGDYTSVVCGFNNAEPQNYTATLTITTCAPGTGCLNGGGGPFGGPDPTVPGNPRYQNFYAPEGSSAQTARGEFNIGFDPITRRIMTMNLTQIWRLTPGEVQTPAKPECCEALWENKSANLVIAEDPILWTDQKSGRTFAANSFYGANFSYAYTDAAAPFDDGTMWVDAGISPPNGGQDHETIGSGPYPLVMGLPNPLSNPVNQGEMVFYCSQNGEGGAGCQRSDTLGASYGPGVLPYDGITTKCGGLHGHVHVALNGTVWLPVNQCAGQQGGAVSTTMGTTWNEFIVAGNNDVNGGAPFTSVVQTHGADPSVGLDANSTAYYCYVSSEAGGTEGHVHVAVSKDNGQTWIRDVDIGASHGIVNAAETEAVGGSAGRAACGFIGTNVPDSVGATYENGNFTGVWYVFIATTYDEGRTWVTVNATPNDPVQNHTGVWQGGGSGENGDRNLLDFNEITIDDRGRVLYGYSDGCHSLTCIQGDNSAGERGGYMRVARQFGGKPLLSQFDVSEPAVPKAPCLSGTRDGSGVHLTWKAPDNGGADIQRYAIYRGTASGAETLLLITNTIKTSFDDITADPTQPVYYQVRAINSVDSNGGAFSQEVNFAATPGIQLLNINSVKTHGTAGDFAVDLPLNGSGIECRSGGTNGDYKIVFNFANPVANVSNASVTAGTGTIASTTTNNGDFVVNLTGVTNAQTIAVTLTGVTDSAGNTASSVTGTMNVLQGDTNSDRFVNSADISQTKSRSGQAVGSSNFRSDLNADGFLNSADISLVKSKSGTALP